MANRNLPTHYRTSTFVKWVAEFRFGKCRQAYFFKELRSFWQRKNLPTHCPTSTFVKWVAELRFGKCFQAYFFQRTAFFLAKKEFANPLSNFYLCKMGWRPRQPTSCDLFRYRKVSGNDKPGLQVELQDVVLPKISYVTIPPYLRYAADEIPVSFPYRNTGTIRDSYRSFMMT